MGLPVPDTRTSSSCTNTTHVLVHGGLLAIDQLAPPPAVTAVVLDPTGGRAPRLIGGALHHRFGHQLNRIPQRTSIFHWILITGGVVVTNAQDDENSPEGTAVVGCCCCLDLVTTPTHPRMRHVPLRLAEHPSALLLDSVLVHHCALSLRLCRRPPNSVALLSWAAGRLDLRLVIPMYAASTLLDVRLQ